MSGARRNEETKLEDLLMRFFQTATVSVGNFLLYLMVVFFSMYNISENCTKNTSGGAGPVLLTLFSVLTFPYFLQ